MNEIEIIEAVLKEARIKSASTFEEWIKVKNFVDLETKQRSTYDKLPKKQQSEIMLQYEKDEIERQKEEEQRKKEIKEEIKRKKLADFEDMDYWSNAKWDNTSVKKRFEKLLQKQLNLLSKDAKSDFKENYEDVIPDLAENFLFSFPFVKNYLDHKGVRDQKGYLMDLIPK